MEYPYYCVGLLLEPLQSDPFFQYKDEAEDEAVSKAAWKTAYGVWEYQNKENVELIAIAFYQKIWTS